MCCVLECSLLARSLAPGLTPPSHSIQAHVPTAQPGRPTGSASERRQRLSEWFLWFELHVTLLCPFYKRSPQRAGIPVITAIVILTVIVTHLGTEHAGFICTFPTYICYFSTISSYCTGNVGAPSCCMSSTMSPTCQARRTGLITAAILLLGAGLLFIQIQSSVLFPICIPTCKQNTVSCLGEFLSI